jgi:phage terminase small subunit
MSKLTPKQVKFCEEYLVDLNATQAAIRAGYSAKTANRIAGQNLIKLDIQAKIEELRLNQQQRTQIDADWVIDRLRKIADFDIRSVCTHDAARGWQFKPIQDWDESAITTMTIAGTDNNGKPKFRAESKLAALESLAKYLGMFDNFNTALTCLRKYGLQIKQAEDGKWSLEDLNV